MSVPAGEFETNKAPPLLHRTWKSRIRACVLGREAIYGGSDIVIIARTDAMAPEGYDAALQRVSPTEEAGNTSQLTPTTTIARSCQRVRCGYGVPRSH